MKIKILLTVLILSTTPLTDSLAEYGNKDKTATIDSTPTQLLRRAVAEGDLATTTKLIEQGVNINSRGELGHTPLIYAAEDGQIEIARLLLDNGARINSQTDGGLHCSLCSRR